LLVVEQAGGVEPQATGGDQPRAVAEGAGNAQGQALVTQQFASTVVEAACPDVEGTLAGDFTLTVIDVIEVAQGQLPAGVDHTTAVVQQSAAQVEA